jgi:hypothetical protein
VQHDTTKQHDIHQQQKAAAAAALIGGAPVYNINRVQILQGTKNLKQKHFDMIIGKPFPKIQHLR